MNQFGMRAYKWEIALLGGSCFQMPCRTQILGIFWQKQKFQAMCWSHGSSSLPLLKWEISVAWRFWHLYAPSQGSACSQISSLLSSCPNSPKVESFHAHVVWLFVFIFASVNCLVQPSSGIKDLDPSFSTLAMKVTSGLLLRTLTSYLN